MKPIKQTTSLWMATTQMPKFQPLNQNIEVDVCIIGGGMVGLSCAYLLNQNGKRVAVLDARSLEENETARTTAHLTNVLDDRYYDLENFFGKENTPLIAESHATAVNFIESVIEKESIECSFRRVPAFLFSPDDAAVLDKEYEACKQAGMHVKFVERAPLPFKTGKCLTFENQAEFSPLHYTAGLTKSILAHAGQIYTHTQAEKIEGGKNPRVLTKEGFEIRSQSIIVATNTPINDRLLIHTKQAAYRTYVLGFQIPKDSVAPGLYYDTLDPYHYIRTSEGKTSDVLIVGGEDHRTGENDQPEECFRQLSNWTRERFSFLGPEIYRWSGQIMEPIDSLAFIGKNPLDENVYIATGDSGNGLTHGTIAGLLITDLILGRKNPWEHLYRPNRKNVHAAKEFAEENLNTFAQYRDWLTPGEKMEPNTGKVIRRGMFKVAVYCDDNEELRVCSAICPHLGGIVRWNDVEKTWDCPCHGSRFTPTGEVLNGPTNKGLQSIKKKNI